MFNKCCELLAKEKIKIAFLKVPLRLPCLSFLFKSLFRRYSDWKPCELRPSRKGKYLAYFRRAY